MALFGAELLSAQESDSSFDEMMKFVMTPTQRTWTGAAGGSFDGEYLGIDLGAKQVKIRQSKNNKEINIALEKLSADDRKWLDARQMLEMRAIPPVTPDIANGVKTIHLPGMRPQPEKVNRHWSEMDYSDFGISFANTYDAGVAGALLWWDDLAWLGIEEQNVVEKMKWLEGKVKSKPTTSGSSALIRLFRDYVSKYAKGKCALHFNPADEVSGVSESYNKSDFNMSQLMQGAAGTNAFFLLLDAYQGEQKQECYVLPVMDVSKNCFWTQFNGRAYLIEFNPEIGKENGAVEFHFSDDSPAPKYLQGRHFRLRDDWFLSVACHVFLEPQQPKDNKVGNGLKQQGIVAPIHPRIPTYKDLPNKPYHYKLETIIYEDKERHGILLAADEHRVWFWMKDEGMSQWEAKECRLKNQSINEWRKAQGQTISR
jgi:hypothetical protein